MRPYKRSRQPKMTTQALLAYDLDESSSDSDFRIEDHDHHGSDDDDGSDASKEDDGRDNSAEDESTSSDDDSSDEDNNDDSDNSTNELRDLLDDNAQTNGQMNGIDKINILIRQMDGKKEHLPKLPIKTICCVCLGDRSDDTNEIIECDGCGVSVHEGCYGVSDNVSISSTNSTCSTEPWFCEACRADVIEPVCELCPNKGGIYKETDVGKWVHLVCALYIPGVAFGEVDQLSSVTLFEMQYSKWGAKVCSLCENTRFARTGVCIGCDAGMCKTYFHVTCAQANGFLTEAHHEDADAADPFYAHCKVHSEKEMMKRRKRNFHTFHLNMQQKQREKLCLKLEDPCPAQMRTQRKLMKYRMKYAAHKQMKSEPWVPTQKMSRLLTTSASACKRLLAKAEIKSVDVELLERQAAQIASLTDIRKKWHIAPAFSVEFIGYYLDRISRTHELKQNLVEMMEANMCLTNEQDTLRKNYDDKLDQNRELKCKQESLINAISVLQKQICTLCPSKNLPNPSNIGGTAQNQEQFKQSSTPPSRPISVPTPAALKMGVGFPLSHLGPPGSKIDSSKMLSTQAKSVSQTGVQIVTPPLQLEQPISAPSTPTLGVQNFDCGICKRCNDQHLLAKCDTCQLHYHLGCLNPPLTRHPKKSKLYGWQCSECDKSDESDVVSEIPKGPRKARTRFNKDGSIASIKENDKEEAMLVNLPNSITAQNQMPSLKRHSTDNSNIINKTAGSRKVLNKPLETCSNIPNKLSKCFESEDGDKSSTSIGNSIVSPRRVLPPVHVMLPSDKPLHLNSSPQPHLIPNVLDTMSSQVNFSQSIPLAEDGGKLARKQRRKEKHKNKHNNASDNEKSPNKEHKRKRKKKDHDYDTGNPNDSNTGVPKIKIKFKTLPLPGEVTPEAQFFYVPADMVRSAEEASRPTSVETVEDTVMQNLDETPVIGSSSVATNSPSKRSPIKNSQSPRKVSPRKTSRSSISSGDVKDLTTTPSQQIKIPMICCVCNEQGITSSIVTCDECRKHYHFATCLEPPLRKTPKIRGYSWHCADCDPTDDDKK